MEMNEADYEKCVRDIPKEDIQQMWDAEKLLIITDESSKRVSRIRAKELIGVAHYICALHRAAFHGTAAVALDDEGYQTLNFDCIQYFKDKKK